MISLSRQERGIFINWLRQEAATNKGLLEQMEKIAIPDMVKQRYKITTAACEVVCALLENTHEDSI